MDNTGNIEQFAQIFKRQTPDERGNWFDFRWGGELLPASCTCIAMIGVGPGGRLIPFSPPFTFADKDSRKQCVELIRTIRKTLVDPYCREHHLGIAWEESGMQESFDEFSAAHWSDSRFENLPTRQELHSQWHESASANG